MAKIEVHAGDFPKGRGNLLFGQFVLPKTEMTFWGQGTQTIGLDELAEVSVATEDSVKRIGGTVGWGVAGAVILGPVGLLAGLLLGGRGKDVTFVAKFKDGRKLLATTNSKAFIQIQAAVF